MDSGPAASRRPGMTMEFEAHFRIPAARFASEFCNSVSLRETEGAGNAGRQPHPQPGVEKKTTPANSPQVRRNTPALPAQWFDGCSVLSPVSRAL